MTAAPAATPRAPRRRRPAGRARRGRGRAPLDPRTRGVGAPGRDRGPVGGAPPARLPGVRRLRRLRAAALRVRSAARMEAGARGARRCAGAGDVAVAACVASPRPLGYRNGRSWCARAHGGRLVLGAYAPRSHEVVDLRRLPHRRAAARRHGDRAAALLDQAGVAAYDERTLTGDLRHVVLRASHDGRVLATWVTRAAARERPGAGARASGPRARRWSASSSTSTAAAATRSSRPTRATTGCWTATRRSRIASRWAARAVRLRLSAARSSRPTAASPRWRTPRSRDALAVRPDERVVDAYCGVGGIALALARRGAGEVIGIEVHAGAVADAMLRGVERRDQRALRRGRRRERARRPRPRRSRRAEPAAQGLRARGPRRGRRASGRARSPTCPAIPTRSARDLALLAARGYRTARVTPFDMLPHTPHVEALAILSAPRPDLRPARSGEAWNVVAAGPLGHRDAGGDGDGERMVDAVHRDADDLVGGARRSPAARRSPRCRTPSCIRRAVRVPQVDVPRPSRTPSASSPALTRAKSRLVGDATMFS